MKNYTFLQICPIFLNTETHHVIRLNKSLVWALATLIYVNLTRSCDLIFY